MTRTPKKKHAAEEDWAARDCPGGQVVLMDISDELAAHVPPSDVHETQGKVVIRMELPGVPPGCVEVWVRGSRIVVRGEKRADQAAGDASFLCLERSFGRFHRAFEVSGAVNLSRLTAVLKGGVLALSIPKCAERRGREHRIPVSSDEGPGEKRGE